MSKTKRRHDTNLSDRVAAFVKGQSNISREQFRAAFPKVTSSAIALLVSMGHLERRPRGNPNAAEVLRIHRERRAAEAAPKREAARLAKIAKLRARLDALEAKAAE